MDRNKNTAPANACCFNNLGSVTFADSGRAAEKNRFRIVGYSGGIIRNHWFWGNVAFDLAGMTFAKEVTPILAEHDRSIRLGFTDRQEITDQVIVEGPFLANDDAEKIRADMKQGFPMEASLRVPPLVVEQVSEGASVEVNGQTLVGPGAVFRESIVKEVSMCVFGVDGKTSSQAFGTETETIKFGLSNKSSSFNGKEKIMTTAAKPEGSGKQPGSDLRACFQASKDLQNEFDNDEDAYRAFVEAEKQGRAGVCGGGKNSATTTLKTEAEMRDEFTNSTGLQDEFEGDTDAYVEFMKAEHDGQAKVFARPTS